MCLNRNIILSHFKVSNLKRHYDVNHGHFHSEYQPKSEIRSNKIKSLKSSAQCEMAMLTEFSKELDVTADTRNAIALNIARSKGSYTDVDNRKKIICTSCIHIGPRKQNVETSYLPDGIVKANQCQCHLKMIWLFRLLLA